MAAAGPRAPRQPPPHTTDKRFSYPPTLDMHDLVSLDDVIERSCGPDGALVCSRTRGGWEEDCIYLVRVSAEGASNGDGVCSAIWPVQPVTG